MPGYAQAGAVADGGNALEFDGDGCGQRRHLHGGAAGLVVLEILGIEPVIGCEIPLHVRQEHGHVHELVPAGTRVLQDEAHVLEHRPALGLDVVGHDLALGVQSHPGDVLAAAFAGTHSGEEQ
jgi:hypothetical protein